MTRVGENLSSIDTRSKMLSFFPHMGGGQTHITPWLLLLFLFLFLLSLFFLLLLFVFSNCGGLKTHFYTASSPFFLTIVLQKPVLGGACKDANA